MIIEQTKDRIRGMRLGAMADELERQISSPDTYGTLGFEERLGLMVDAEWARRQANITQKLIKSARFAIPGASVEAIE